MLVAVVVMVVLVLIALSAAAPVIAKDLRRQKEIESQHRMQQYVRAIRLYYRKTHAYPPSIDALKNTNNVRFLRQEYVDPLTGKSDWRLIHLGEQKTTVKGFFGQELGGIASSGLGSAAGMSSGLGSAAGSASSSTTSTIGATSPLASGFQGASTTSTTGATGSTGGLGSLSSFASTGSTGAGGGAIVGVGTAKTGTSISTPNQQGTYETWEFWYDPRIELLYQKGHTNAGMGSGSLSSQPASSFGSGINGQPNGAPGSTGSTFGNSPGSVFPSSPTTSPTAPTTPTTPQ